MTFGLGYCIYDYSMSEGFEPGAFKMVKNNYEKNVNVSSRLEPVSFTVVAQDATTELQYRIK